MNETLKDYSFVFDIDGTLCPIKGKDERYEDIVPYPEMIDRLREYKAQGARIVLSTSRNMNSYQGDLGKINKYTARTLLDWLEKWDIPYDEIYYGKPWPGHKGFYVDDRSVRPDEWLHSSMAELGELCRQSRCDSGQLDIVITMGGLGSRFRKAGYDCPKYMIEAKGKTLFDWSLISLQGYAAQAAQYIFLAMKDETHDVESFIREHCRQLGIERYHIILLDDVTDGQATTAMLASKYWNLQHGILIYNIDTYIEPGQMTADELHGDGFIPCFRGEGDHWSFVRTDETGKAVEIREKERVAENCTVGAYYFRSCKLYEQLYLEYYSIPGHMVKGEKYVAPLYQYLIDKGGAVYISDIPAEHVHVLGTPQELDAFLKEN